MKLNYKIFLFLSAIFLLQNSCAQNPKKAENTSTEYRDKIKNNYKNIKSYDYNPIYQIRFDKFECPIEFYINDVLVVSLLDNDRSAGEQIVQCPQYILKSGLQNIRVKIYPLLDKNKNFEKFVSRNIQLKLRVTYQDYERDLRIDPKNFKEVFKAELPKLEKDVPSIELNKEFTVTVPYELKGWSNGMDLNKEDPEKLEQEVKDRLKEIAGLYRNKNIEGLAKEHYNRVKEIDQAYYFTTKENSAEWESEMLDDLNASINIELLEGKMKIMANGKLVTILIDKGAFYNKAVIRNETKDNYIVYPQYFYRPASGAKLEVIR